MSSAYDDADDRIPFGPQIVGAALAKALERDSANRSWDNPRDAPVKSPPWPDEDDPVLRYLTVKALADLAAGVDVRHVVMQLAVHAWFEGGVDAYDLGQHDARRPRLV